MIEWAIYIVVLVVAELELHDSPSPLLVASHDVAAFMPSTASTSLTIFKSMPLRNLAFFSMSDEILFLLASDL
jgi:hypothetical protein